MFTFFWEHNEKNAMFRFYQKKENKYILYSVLYLKIPQLDKIGIRR